MEIRRVTPDEWPALRDARLRALVDAPSAFGTTYDEALARPDDWWIRWAERCAADSTQAMFVAWEGDVAIGLAGAYGDEHRFDVISMWTDPGHRRRGVGSALLATAIAFAGSVPVFLSVTEDNVAARRLYEQHGFAATGVTEPLRSQPELSIHELKLEP
jgi:ribosomal protein S18 acetylase RimI-like enzyme